MVNVQVTGPDVARADEVLTPEALGLVAELQTRFGAERDALLAARAERRAELASGRRVELGTAAIRDGDWRVPPPPPGTAERLLDVAGVPGARTMAGLRAWRWRSATWRRGWAAAVRSGSTT
jgi:malate synthase